MISHSKIQKHLSKIKESGPIKSKYGPSSHVVQRAFIKDPKKEWVLKELKPNLEYLKIRGESLDNPTDGLQSILSQTTNKDYLYTDILANEYMSFMSGTKFHSRIVLDDDQKMHGKLSTFIPNLTVCADVLREKEKTLEKNKTKKFFLIKQASLLKKLNSIFQDEAPTCFRTIEDEEDKDKVGMRLKDLGNLLNKQMEDALQEAKLHECADKTIQEVSRCAIQERNKEYFKLLLNDDILPSFAQNSVFIHRLILSDVHGGNIGIVGNKMIVFDAEASLASAYLDRMESKYVNEIAKRSWWEWRPGLDFMKDIKNFLGEEKFDLLLQYQYRFWLKDLLCPDSFIQKLTSFHAIPELKEEAEKAKTFFANSTQIWRGLLLQNEEFVTYLKRSGDKDFKEIMAEYKEAQEIHPYYADPNMLNEVEGKYRQILESLSLKKSPENAADEKESVAPASNQNRPS